MYKKIHFIFCSFIPVGLDDYVKYFIDKFEDFYYLKWKFHHIESTTKSSLSTYHNGKNIKETYIFSPLTVRNVYFYFLFLPFNYLIYFLQALLLLWKRDNGKKRVYMGVNYFCTFCGIVLKKLGKVDFVIYRVMDFFPIPPKGAYRYLNRIFHIIDNFCLTHSDSIWFTTENHIAGREKYHYFNREKYNYELVPLGVNIRKSIIDLNFENKKQSLVYCGVISKYHLIDLLFNVMKILTKEFPNLRLKIIGSGPDEHYFKILAKKTNIQKNIVFYGFVPEGKQFTKIMSESNLGLALYRDEEDFIKYTEPAKVKYYLSFGIPAVISNVPLIAQELHNKKVSFSVENNAYEIAETIKNYLKNKKKQKEYKRNIEEFIKTIDISMLLFKTLLKTLKNYHG